MIEPLATVGSSEARKIRYPRTAFVAFTASDEKKSGSAFSHSLPAYQAVSSNRWPARVSPNLSPSSLLPLLQQWQLTGVPPNVSLPRNGNGAPTSYRDHGVVMCQPVVSDNALVAA